MDIMLKSNYEFHKAFISSKILLKNKYLLDKMRLIDNLLQNGKSINYSFFKTQIFDDIQLLKLFGRVIAVAGMPVDLMRFEQTDFIIVTQCFDRDIHQF